MSGAMASDHAGKFAVSRQSTRHLPVNDNEYLGVLYFDGAVFSDSLPRLPVFSHRMTNPVPHFSHTFRISDETFDPARELTIQFQIPVKGDDLIGKCRFVRVIHGSGFVENQKKAPQPCKSIGISQKFSL